MNMAGSPETPIVTTGEYFQIIQVKRYLGPTVTGWQGIQSAFEVVSSLKRPSDSATFLTALNPDSVDYESIDPVNLLKKVKYGLKTADRVVSNIAINLAGDHVQYERAKLIVDSFAGREKFVVGVSPMFEWDDRTEDDQINERLSESLGKPRALERIDISIAPHDDLHGELFDSELRSLLVPAENEIRSTRSDQTFVRGNRLRKLQQASEVLIKENGDGIGLYYSIQSDPKDMLVEAVQMQLLLRSMPVPPSLVYHFSVRRPLIVEDSPPGFISNMRPNDAHKAGPPMAVSEPKNQRMMEKVAQKIVEAFR